MLNKMWLVAILVLLSITPAFAEAYTVEKNAWMCALGQEDGIKEVENLANRGDKTSIQEIKKYFEDCEKAGTQRGVYTGESMFSSPGDEIVNHPITVMYATGPLVFVCSQTKYCLADGRPMSAPIFRCGYALVADMRDSHNQPVTLQQMQKEAKGKTMADIPNTSPHWSEGCSK
jgi:hypothetical protein